jgi:hypothetical protein
MTWSVDGSGTQTAILGTEHIVWTTTSGAAGALTFVFAVDTALMVNADLVEFRAYDMVDGSNFRQMWKGTYQHAQINNAKPSPPQATTTQAKFTIRQVMGTVPIGTVTGTVPSGSSVTGNTSAATGIAYTLSGTGNLVSSTNIILRWLTGTFTNGETVQLTVGNNFVLTNATGRAYPWSVRKI